MQLAACSLQKTESSTSSVIKRVYNTGTLLISRMKLQEVHNVQ